MTSHSIQLGTRTGSRTATKFVKLPKNGSNVENRYKDLDILVYLNSINIQERVQSKKNVLGVLMSKPKINENLTKIPLKSMVTIANQTIQRYLDTLDETTKKNVFHVFAGNQEDLEKDQFKTH